MTEPLRPGVVLDMIGLVETAGEAALLDLLERAVRDEHVMAQLRATVSALPLAKSKRVRLDHALGHVLAGEFLFAIDALIAMVEGLFWLEAESRDLIRGRNKFTPASGRTGTAHGVEKLFPVLEVPPVFREFLVRCAYGGRGDPFRHGRAEEGEREQVLFLIVALAGWLETFAGIEARSWLLASLERELTSGTAASADHSAADSETMATSAVRKLTGSL